MGWMGMAKDVEYALAVVGADKDESGKFLITGEKFASFMGLGEELVIGDSTFYLVNGQQGNLAVLMNDTSYGLRNVRVII